MGCVGSKEDEQASSSASEILPPKSAMSISKKNPSFAKLSSFMSKGSPKLTSFRGSGASRASFPIVDQNLLRAASLAREQSAISIAEAMMLTTKGQRFHDNYVRPTLVSYGGSCKVLTAFSKTTKGKYAVKIIPKDPRKIAEQRQKVLMEIGILREIEDHPNAIRLHEVYNDIHSYYLVMQCCDGGELFEHITKGKEAFTEGHAAKILQSLMLFLAHIHSKGIVHMDIKPENIMFDNDGVNGVLKLIDFGASVHVQEQENVKDAFGTVRYSSPEMALDSGIGQKTDIWSAGVVMYYLLCGQAPFLKQNDVDTLNMIKKGPKVQFSGSVWRSVSQSAKECIKAMLEVDPYMRPSAQEVLQMPWLIEKAPSTSIIKNDILGHLRSFANQSRIRRLLLGLMASSLSGSDANSLLNHFFCMDSDFSGTLEINELADAAKKALPDLTDDEVENIFSALDLNETGTVDTREFFASLLHTMAPANQLVVAKKSFGHLDRDGHGFVNQKEFVEAMVKQAVASGMAKEDAEKLLTELEAEFENLDANRDGRLDFNEFKSILGLEGSSGQTGRPMLARSVSGRERPGPSPLSHQPQTEGSDDHGSMEANVEQKKTLTGNNSKKTLSRNDSSSQHPVNNSIHSSAAILRLALNIQDPDSSLKSRTKTASGVPRPDAEAPGSMKRSPSMPRVGFLTDMPSENEDPSPFPQLSGSQVPGFVPSPTPSMANRQFQSGKDQSATKQTAMAAAAVTAAVAATRAVTSHRSGDHDESFRANNSSPSPFEPSDLTEVEEDRAEDGAVVQFSERPVLTASASGRWLSNATASKGLLKKESMQISGDPFQVEEVNSPTVIGRINSRRQLLASGSMARSPSFGSRPGSFNGQLQDQSPLRIGVVPVSPLPDQCLPPLRTPSGRILSNGHGPGNRDPETLEFLQSHMMEDRQSYEVGGGVSLSREEEEDK